MSAPPVSTPNCIDACPGAGMGADDDRAGRMPRGRLEQGLDQAAQARSDVHVLRPVHGHQEVLARLQAESSSTVRRVDLGLVVRR